MFEELKRELENAIEMLQDWQLKILEEDITEAIKNRIRVLKNAR